MELSGYKLLDLGRKLMGYGRVEDTQTPPDGSSSLIPKMPRPYVVHAINTFKLFLSVAPTKW